MTADEVAEYEMTADKMTNKKNGWQTDIRIRERERKKKNEK